MKPYPAALNLLVCILLAICYAAEAFAIAKPTAAPQATSPPAQPVLLVQNDWTSQVVLAHIVGHILEDEGFPVKFVPFDSQLQFQALADGAVHFQIAAWQGPMYEAYEQALGIGMVDAGTHAASTREGWWIPHYVLNECPDAANWQGLNDCAHLFAPDDADMTGQFTGPPADWGKNYARLITALQMNFAITNVNTPQELWSTLQNAYKNRAPVVLFNWTPNFTDVMYDGRFVDFPEPTDACESDASWGPNPDATGDCGERRSNWLKKAAWSGLAQMYPAAWKILKRVNFTNEQIASAIKMVDIDEMQPVDAARLWIEQNSFVVQQWLGRR